jgi:cellulose synthase/poly-beta-1,6-N-acetylglucosamine synthase-like glycosyltransferase
MEGKRRIITKKYCENPIISVIIPSLYYNERSENIANLQNDIEQQTFKSLEVIFVIGDTRQGRAINTGAKLAKGEVLIILDDDTRLGNKEVFENLYNALKEHKDYGLVGASCEIPPNSSILTKKILKEIPRRYFPVQKYDRDSDMVQHPCLAIKKELFFKIGGEDEEIIRGLDPILRFKVKQAGYRVVIIKDTYIYHLPPTNLVKLIKMYYRNGKGAGFAKKYYPHKIYDVDAGFNPFYTPKKTYFSLRIIRAFTTLFIKCIEGKILNLTVLISYYIGFIVEYFFSTYKIES